MTKNIILPVVLAGVVASFVSGYNIGKRSGVNDGMQAGVWHGNLNSIVMILSYRSLQDKGDLEGARIHLDKSLYANALNLESNQISKALSDDNRNAGQEMMKLVAEYYWKNYANHSIEIPNNSMSDSHLKIQDVFEPYRPSR